MKNDVSVSHVEINSGNTITAEDPQVLTPGGYRPKSKVHAASEETPPPQDDEVLTPGGFRPRSQVHFIEAGNSLNGADERLKIIHPSGAEVKDIGALPHRPGGAPLMPLNVHIPAHKVVPAFGAGWVAYAGWTNNSGHPVSSFSTTWTVPPDPVTQSGQTIFLFNGIQNSTMIYQPVLQWGSSAAGGGNYWSVACWYVDGQGGVAFHSNLIRVNSGTVLTGVMTLTGQSGNLFSYTSSFQGIANSGYAINNVEQLTWLNETLEVYGITKASDYPSTDDTIFRAINIKAGGTNPVVSWTANSPITDIGQHASILSNSSVNGEVDIFYRGILMAWKGINNDQGIYYSTFGGNNWTPQRLVAGIGSSVGPTLALFNDRVMMAWKGINNDQGIYFSSFDGANWAAQRNVAGVGTSYRPSLAVFNGRLYMAWKGINADQGIYFSSFDGLNWAPQRNIAGVGSSVGPSLAVFNGRLYAAWKGINADQGIYFSSFDGTSWATQRNIAGVGSSVGPSLAVFNGRLYAAWKGMNADQGIYFSSFDGVNWAVQRNVAGVGTSTAPDLASYGGRLYMSWKGINADQGIYFSTFDGANWAAQQNVAGVGTSVRTGITSL